MPPAGSVFGQHRRNARVDRLRSLKGWNLPMPPTIPLDEQPTTKTSPFSAFACASSSVTACRASFSIRFFELFRHRKTPRLHSPADSRLAEPAAPEIYFAARRAELLQCGRPSPGPVKVRSQLPSPYPPPRRRARPPTGRTASAAYFHRPAGRCSAAGCGPRSFQPVAARPAVADVGMPSRPAPSAPG